MATVTALDPGQNSTTEKWLEKFGVKWVHHVGVSTDEFDVEECLHNQARINTVVVQPRVDQYADAMTGGDEFPSIVAYRKKGKLITIDGNHRLMAAIHAGLNVTVYEVTGRLPVIAVMTIVANAQHGLPLDESEKLAHAVRLAQQGVSIADIALRLSLSKSKVDSAVKGRKADSRAGEAGVLRTKWERIPASVRARLGSVTTDAGFRAAAELVLDARLTTEETAGLVAEVNQVRDSDTQAAVVQALRGTSTYVDKIQGSAGGIIGPAKGKRVMTPRAELEKILSRAQTLPAAPSIVDGIGRPERDEIADQCRGAAHRLTELANLLEA